MLAALVLAAALVPPVAQTPPPLGNANDPGYLAYTQHCATCHGADLRGGENAPSLRGVGAADVDFWVSTGRMPAAVPWIQVAHRGAQLSQPTIDAIVAYVTRVAPGGPPIPIVDAGGDPQRGAELFRQNCEHCHGAAAAGAAIGGVDFAPSLSRATVTQVAEAIRIGPGEMPHFGARQLPPGDVDDIAAYLSRMHADSGFQGLPAESSGPVPEGFLGWLAAGVLALAAYGFSAPVRRKDA